MARLAITSLAFMFDWVREPVWNTTSGNSSSQPPAITSSGARDQIRLVGGELAERAVGERRVLLDDAERSDDPAAPVKAPPADREVLQRALRLRAPEMLGGNGNLAERVLFDPRLRHTSRIR